MNILHIPNEILDQIAIFLDYDSDISALSQTCKDLHSIAGRILALRKPTDPQSSDYYIWLKHLLMKRDVIKLRRLLTSTIKLPRDENIIGFVSSFAVKWGDLEVVRLVVDDYPVCLTQKHGGMSLTEIAARYDHPTINTLLTSRGCLDSRPENREIFDALEEGSLSKFRHAIEVLKCPIDSQTALGRGFSSGMVGRPYYSCTPLWVAAYKGRLDIVKYLINLGADPNFESDPVPALFAAAWKNRSKVVTFLLESGAHPDLEKIDYSTWMDLLDFRTEMTALLVEKLDFDAFSVRAFNSVDSTNLKSTERTAVHLLRFAKRSGKKELMTSLLQGKHSSIIRKAISGNGGLLECLVRDGYIEEVDSIITSSGMHQSPSVFFDTLFNTMRSVLIDYDWRQNQHGLFLDKHIYDGISVLKYFYKKTQNSLNLPVIALEPINAQKIGLASSQEPVQHHTNQVAVFKDMWMQSFKRYFTRGDVLQVFVDLGFPQYLTSDEVKDTFQGISIHGSRASFQIWLQQVLPHFGLDLDSPSFKGDWRYRAAQTPPEAHFKTLFEYALYGCPSASLFSRVARPNLELALTDKTCLKLLELAVRNCRTETIKWFFNNGFQADIKCGDNDTPLLCLAAQSEFNVTNTLNLFLDRGVSVNATNEYNESALYYAVKYGKNPLKVVRTLLAHGADPLLCSNRCDKFEHGTPLGQAVLKQNVEIVKVFLEVLDSRRVTIDWLLSLVPRGKGDRDLEIARALRRSHDKFHWRMAYPVPGS